MAVSLATPVFKALAGGNTLKHYEPDVVLTGYVVQVTPEKRHIPISLRPFFQKDSRSLFRDNLFYRSKIYLALRSALGAVQIRAKERGSGDEGGVYQGPTPGLCGQSERSDFSHSESRRHRCSLDTP